MTGSLARLAALAMAALDIGPSWHEADAIPGFDFWGDVDTAFIAACSPTAILAIAAAVRRAVDSPGWRYHGLTHTTSDCQECDEARAAFAALARLVVEKEDDG